MLFDIIGRVRQSLGAKIITVYLMSLCAVCLITATYYVYDKHRSVKLEIIHNGLMLLEITSLLSKPGLIEESREKLKNEVAGVFWDKDLLEVSVYDRNVEILLNKRFKDLTVVKGSDEETAEERKTIFKKISSGGLFPVFVEKKDSFRYYSPVFRSSQVVINSRNLKTNNKNLVNKEIIGFVFLERDKSELKHKLIKVSISISLLFSASFVVGSFFIFYILKKMGRPLNLLTNEIKSLEQGKQTKEVSVKTSDEIGKLASAFNRMFKTIKAREKALEETSNQLLMAFEASNEGLYDFALNTNDVLFSPTWYEMLGYEPYEIPSTVETVNKLIHPEDRERVSKAEREFITQKKERLNVDFRLRTKSGAYKWIASRGKAVEFNSEGRPKRLMGAHIDITELKEAQKKIQDLSRQILSAQEIERQRIARDLHDNVAQNLSSLKILFQTLLAGGSVPSKENKEKAKNITEIIQLCIRDVRNMSYDLCPPELDQLGLAKAVEQFSNLFSTREKIEIDLKIHGLNENLLSPDININLYRLVQESLNNIKKHADATRVNILMISSFPDIIIRIEDNGKGFDVEDRKTAALKEKRMGLENMIERVSLLGGEISIKSQANKGTRIDIIIPYKEKK